MSTHEQQEQLGELYSTLLGMLESGKADEAEFQALVKKHGAKTVAWMLDVVKADMEGNP